MAKRTPRFPGERAKTGNLLALGDWRAWRGGQGGRFAGCARASSAARELEGGKRPGAKRASIARFRSRDFQCKPSLSAQAEAREARAAIGAGPAQKAQEHRSNAAGGSARSPRAPGRSSAGAACRLDVGASARIRDAASKSITSLHIEDSHAYRVHRADCRLARLTSGYTTRRGRWRRRSGEPR